MLPSKTEIDEKTQIYDPDSPNPFADEHIGSSISSLACNIPNCIKYVRRGSENIIDILEKMDVQNHRGSIRCDYVTEIYTQIHKIKFCIDNGILNSMPQNCIASLKSEVGEAALDATVSAGTDDDHFILKVSMTPQDPRTEKQSYDTFYYLKPIIQKFMKENFWLYETKKIHPSLQYFLVYHRFVSKTRHGRAFACDNDNVELKRTTNAIAESIAVSDDINHMSFVYMTSPAEKDHLDIYLVKKEEFPAFNAAGLW